MGEVCLFNLHLKYCAKVMKAKFAEFGPLFSRKFDESSPPRIFVESNEMSLSSCRKVASTEANFVLLKFRRKEN